MVLLKKNYGTIPRTMQLRLTKEKIWQITKNYETLIYYGKTNGDKSKPLKLLKTIKAFEL